MLAVLATISLSSAGCEEWRNHQQKGQHQIASTYDFSNNDESVHRLWVKGDEKQHVIDSLVTVLKSHR